jgi:hypothetical protein
MLRQLRSSWPKLIAALVAAIGVSGILTGWTFSFGPSGNSIGWFWPQMAVSVSLVILSYPLATGRDWARRVLMVAVVFIGVVFAFWHAVRLFDFPKSFSHSSEEQSRLIGLCLLLEDISALLVVLTVVVFGMLFLSHPDIIATFRRGSQKV